MSIGGVSSSYSTGRPDFGSSGLPRLSKDQLTAMREQLKPLSGVILPAWSALGPPLPRIESETTRVVGGNGASVAVTQHPPAENQSGSFTLHLGEGSGQFDIALRGNARISMTEEGQYAVYFSQGNVTRTYAADGSFTEVSEDQTSTDAGRIFISTDSEALQGGAGNDTFLVYGGGSINTGEGDNTVILKNFYAGNAVTTGNGNNRVTCENNYFGTMTLGDGDNTLSLGALADRGSVDAGSGNISLSIGKMHGGWVTCMGTAEKNTERTISIGSMSGASKVTVCNGKNTVDIGSMQGSADVFQFNGEAVLDIGQVSDAARVWCHAGTAAVAIRDMTGRAWVDVGGNSSVHVDNISGSASLMISDSPGYLCFLGEEPPKVSAEVYVGKMQDSAALSFIGSEHMIAIAAMRDDATLRAGIPEVSDSFLVVGSADATAELPRDSKKLSVLSELGQEDLENVKAALAKWRVARENAGFPAAREDLWASLHGKMGKEEELMQRVTLLQPWM